MHISDKDNREGWIGYVLNKLYWKKGYGTEIGRMLLDIGFNNFKLHRIYDTCYTDSLGPQKIVMTKEVYYSEDKK